MMKNLENQVLAKLKESKEPKKKRVTFFLSSSTKEALQRWCKENDVFESAAIEEMIRATVPQKFFKER